MTTYLLKVIICSGILYAFYILFLEKEKMHVFNRFYLLGSLLVSYFIPLITFEVQAPQSFVDTKDTLPLNNEIPVITVQQTTTSLFTFENVVWVMMIIISLFFLIRFLAGLIKINRIIKENELSVLDKNTILVNIEKLTSPFSFGKYIFINKEETDERILLHELTHIRQKHWIDNIFMELLIIISWINPVIFFYKKSIKINHEFLADNAVIKNFDDIDNYRLLLVNKVFAQNHVLLSSTFNFFTTKKRLVMLYKKTSRMQRAIRIAVIVPVLGLLIYYISDKVYAQEVPPPPLIENTSVEENTSDGISKEELETYNRIIAKYGLNKDSYKTKSGRTLLGSVSNEDYNKLLNLYLRMNAEQVSMQFIHFIKPPKPFEKAVPTQTQMAKWKNPDLYGIWIDEKKVPNSELNKYKPNDFSHYFASKLYGAAKKGKRYDVQLDLMTNDYYAEYYKKATDNLNKYSMVLGKRTVATAKPLSQGVSDAELKEYVSLMNEMKIVKNGRTYYRIIEGKAERSDIIYGKMSEEQKDKVGRRPPPPPPGGATKREMQEYIALVQKGNKGENEFYLDEEDIKRAGELYIKMNEQQRKSLTYVIPPPPPIPQKVDINKKGFREKEINEYEKLFNSLGTHMPNGDKSFAYNEKTNSQLEAIYAKMNAEQRKKVIAPPLKHGRVVISKKGEVIVVEKYNPEK